MCYSWKISSSLSRNALVHLVMVRGTSSYATCCCILEDDMTLWDLVRRCQADVLLVQASSKAATLLRINRWKENVTTYRITNIKFWSTTSAHIISILYLFLFCMKTRRGSKEFVWPWWWTGLLNVWPETRDGFSLKCHLILMQFSQHWSPSIFTI